MVMGQLAMFGGARAVPKGTKPPPWPVVTADDHEAVLEVLRGGKFTAAAAGEPHIPALEREWAAQVGSAHCIAVANGTVALTIALAAAGVRAGDEVIVPALSFIGSALAPAHLGAIPVFVDIDPVTYNLDTSALAAAVSERTTAVMPVHLHGLPADLDEITAFARRHGLVVVEDSAQSHGVGYRGRVTGSVGQAGAVSLNVSKNLPTCGEGGLITTDDDGLAGRARLMRQFGEDIPDRGERPYESRTVGWNAKINTIQAAFTRRQLGRFADQSAARDVMVRAFLAKVSGLPGLIVPTVPGDREHGWHILRFRVQPETFGLPAECAGAVRAAVCRALRGEGVPVSRYQSMPLGAQPVFRDGRLPSRSLEVPVTTEVVTDSFVLQRVHLNPESGAVLDAIAEAIVKVWSHRDLIASIAGSGSRNAQPAPAGR
jgi:perosamine synthetase